MKKPTLNNPNVEQISLESLIPYARNARKHSDEQVAQLAASICEFGFNNPVLVGADNDIIAGHGRVLAARKLGLDAVPCLRLDHLTEAQKRAYVIADNKLALNAGWDNELLKLELVSLRDEEAFDLGLTGFSDAELEALLSVEIVKSNSEVDADKVPETKLDPVSVIGDVWVLDQHRVMCGDSIMFDAVQKLMAGQTAQLIHADPPYGMGKESDGVMNDNIRGEKLDRFQMDWWALWRSFTDSNGSAYIWGNAPDLWRLWYRGGLGDSEHMELRNQIVWDKKAIPGMKSDLLTQYPITTEHCLFFQLGQQFLGNINTEYFPESWEPLRAYMENEAKAANIGANDIKRICGVGMYSHWFTRSQFNLIPEKHYKSLAAEYTGRFTRPWCELKAEWTRVKILDARSYFDNAHDIMRDVWEFSRVFGDERHGHATPKPVEMMERVMKSSLPKGGLCIEPFGGSGSTLIAAERTGRKCFCMEITPAYVDVIVERWQKLTGKQAVHESGKTFDEMKAERQK